MEVVVDFKEINDWQSFHRVFARVMGFPDFYRCKKSAWIDCMSCIDNRDACMSGITIEPGEHLIISISGVDEAVQTSSEVLVGFLEIVAAVNRRFEKAGAGTRLCVAAL